MPARYDAVADFYQARFSDTADPVLTALLDLLGPVDQRRVLDVACGHGRATRELARRGAVAMGVDLSRAMLDKAEQIERTDPLGVTYRHADVSTAADIDAAPFDAVVCNFGLSDIDDLDGAASFVWRALRPDGAFVFSILHPCFPGADAMAGSWPRAGRYYDEGFWLADNEASTLRRRVGANHRKLSTYLNTVIRHDLTLSEIREPAPPAHHGPPRRRRPPALPPRPLH